MADLLPNHAKEDIYFCKQCLAHAWTYLADCIQVGLYVAWEAKMFYLTFSDLSCLCLHLLLSVEMFLLIGDVLPLTACDVEGQ